MGYKKVIIPIDDLRRIIENVRVNFTSIYNYIDYMKTCGLRPYRKDIRPSFKGLGEDPKNHFPFKESFYYRFMIINQKNWMLTKIKYGI